jgi:hypothetical protein
MSNITKTTEKKKINYTPNEKNKAKELEDINEKNMDKYLKNLNLFSDKNKQEVKNIIPLNKDLKKFKDSIDQNVENKESESSGMMQTSGNQGNMQENLPSENLGLNTNPQNREEINIDRDQGTQNNPNDGDGGNNNPGSDHDDSGDESDEEEGDLFDEESLNIIDVTNEHMLSSLNKLVKYGSRVLILTASQVRIHYQISIDGDVNRDTFQFNNLNSLLKHGNKLIDSIVYLFGNNKNLIRITFLEVDNNIVVPTLLEYALSSFLLYFWLIVQGSPPKNNSFIPAIISKTFEIDRTRFNYIISLLSTFSLHAIDHKWVRFVDISNLGNEVRNRICLGMAGYRYIKAIALNPPKKNLNIPKRYLFNIIFSLYSHGLRWELHPIFKSESSNASISMNKNLINFMLDIYSSDELVDMKAARMIPNINLSRSKADISYRTWILSMFNYVRTSIIDQTDVSQPTYISYYNLSDNDLVGLSGNFYEEYEEVLDNHNINFAFNY